MVTSYPEKTKATAPVTEIGYQVSNPYYWWQWLDETTPELVWPQSVYVYDQMRKTDSQVGSILRAVALLVLRTPWRVDPNGARKEVVEFVADDLGLPIVGQEAKAPPRTKDRFSWKDHLAEALLMLPLGHSYFEQVYRVDKDGKRAHLRKLALRPAKTIQKVNVAKDGGLVSIEQYWAPSDGEGPATIPVDRLVAYIHAKEGANWLGTSILRNCYKNWLLKDRLLRVQAQTIERNGMGIPLYTAQEGASGTDMASGLAMAKAWRAGESAGTAVPFGASLKLVGVEGTLPDSEPAIRYHDESIAKTVLAHFLNLGQQMGTGSYALGATLGDFFTLGVQTVGQQLADVANCHVVEDLVDINFGETEPAPKIVFDEIGSRQAATAEALSSLVGAGVIRPDEVLEGQARQYYGLPPADTSTMRTPPAGVPTDAPPAPPPPPAEMGATSVAASGEPDDPSAGARPSDPDPVPPPPPAPVAASAPELLGEDVDDFADLIGELLDEWVADQIPPEPIAAKFDPSQPRDRHGRWSLTAAVIDALKKQGGTQGHTQFDDGQYFDWSTYNPSTDTYNLEIGDEEDSVSFQLDTQQMEGLFSALTVTRLRDAHPDGHAQPHIAALAALGQTDHFIPNHGEDASSIDWSIRTKHGDYSFGVENDEGDSVGFDLSPTEMDKLIASLALSTQPPIQARAYVAAKYHPEELRIPGGKGGGRWTANPIGKAIAHALEEWGRGNGPDDPFHFDGKPIDREPLRKAAVARGINLRWGAPREEIVEALLAGARGEVKAQRVERQKRLGSGKFTITHGGKRVDVAVYTDAATGKKASLYLQSDTGRKGRLVTAQDDLAGLESWARDNGHTDVADWAAKERGGDKVEAPAPEKAAKKATKRAPAKKAAPKTTSATDADARAAQRQLDREAAKKAAAGKSAPAVEKVAPAKAATAAAKKAAPKAGVGAGASLEGRTTGDLRKIAEAEGIPLPKAGTRDQLAQTISDFRFRRDGRDGIVVFKRELAKGELGGPSDVGTPIAKPHRAAGAKSVAQLRREATADGIPLPKSGTAAELEQAIADFKFHRDTEEGSAHLHFQDPTKAPGHPDGLDSLDEPRLRSLAKEYEIPGAATKTPAALKAALRRKGAVAPDVTSAAPKAAPVSDAEVEDRIRAGYFARTQRPGMAVSLADIRQDLGDLDRAQVDDVLKRMNRTNHVDLSQGVKLTPAQRDAAAEIGGLPKHNIVIEQNSPRSIPAPAGHVVKDYAGPKAPGPTPEQRAQIEADIRAAYQRLARRPGGYVKMADIRDQIGSHDRPHVDEVLVDLNRNSPDLQIVAESNQKSLTARDIAAAVTFGGGRDRHMLVIAPKRLDRPPGSGSGFVPAAADPAARPAVGKLYQGTGYGPPTTFSGNAAVNYAERRLRAGDDPAQVAEDLRQAGRALRQQKLTDGDVQDRLTRSPGELKELRDSEARRLIATADAIEAGGVGPKGESVRSSAGHHTPGEPQRYRHGWIPIGNLRGPTADEMQAGLAAPGERQEEQLFGGAMAQTRKVTLPNGVVVVRKTDYQDSLEREHLASLVGHAINAPVPYVMPPVPESGEHRFPKASVHMGFAPGEFGGDVAEGIGHDAFEGRVMASDDAVLLGLLDTLIANRDRNDTNWLAEHHGDEIRLTGIDHASAFARNQLHPQTREVLPLRGLAELPNEDLSNPFARHFIAVGAIDDHGRKMDAWAAGNPMSPHDMATIGDRLQALRGDFDASGHLQWWDEMMARYAEIAKRAGGTRSRL